MDFNKECGVGRTYELTITRPGNEDSVYAWRFCLDATGLAALIRSIDVATNEGKMARSIGLRRKRRPGHD
ncbi:MAG: hypothetical protein IID41_07400 [Planctomycetes bacterium]|nr:hypothetical protein [Planctomycetota bacterium]